LIRRTGEKFFAPTVFRDLYKFFIPKKALAGGEGGERVEKNYTVVLMGNADSRNLETEPNGFFHHVSFFIFSVYATIDPIQGGFS
jgi:hypothetical protein